MNEQKRELLLVTGSRYTQAAVARQLYQYLDDAVEIVSFMVDEDNGELTKPYFVVFSSEEVYDDFISMGNGKYIQDYIIATRTILHDKLDKVLVLPRGEKILLVNDSLMSAQEGIENLKKSGFDFLDYVPYYPGSGVDIRGIQIAITPGELDKIPKGINEVYDIGVRIIDFSSIIRILRKLSLLDDRVQHFADLYIGSLMDFAKRVSNVVNETAKLTKTVREEVIGKGYYAKYRFDDIVGETDEICATKKIAEKIARTDLTVLIEGENGTGKELFASAMHNASGRVKNPFVAINFSALPDELIESELFGYEEGSFTGAKKGGKVGLFQQANGGTIFLDEIGDISLKMQAKLLRVIQEKEIMKVGADKIIPVDVRIIAATNRDLKKMIEEKSFRKDLYYRLKMGYIHIPPLRERKEDVPLLIRHWLGTKFDEDIRIDDDIMKRFIEHDWPGNVRELLNIMKYAVAVCEKKRITLMDLPYDSLIQFRESEDEDERSGPGSAQRLSGYAQRSSGGSGIGGHGGNRGSSGSGGSEIGRSGSGWHGGSRVSGGSGDWTGGYGSSESSWHGGNGFSERERGRNAYETKSGSAAEWNAERAAEWGPERDGGRNAAWETLPPDRCSLKLLSAVAEMNERGQLAGRRRVMERLNEEGISISDYKVRKLLGQLADKGFLLHREGSYGLEVTAAGRNLAESAKTPE